LALLNDGLVKIPDEVLARFRRLSAAAAARLLALAEEDV